MYLYMGNLSTIETQNRNLVVKNRLLERQASQCTRVDSLTQNAIADIKKNRKYANLVFCGNTVKSLAYVGALGYLHDKRHLTNVRSIACTSIGAIFATLYAVGYSVPELKQLAETMDFEELFHTERPLVSDIYHVAMGGPKSEYGLNNGQFFVDTMAELIERKVGSKHYTLEQLYREKGITLMVSAGDLSSGRLTYFWYGDYPRLPLRTVLRIACSIPGILAPVIFDGHHLIDGSFVDSSPVHIFDDGSIDPRTLCLALVADLPIYDTDPISAGDISVLSTVTKIHKITSPLTYLGALADTLTDTGRNMHRPDFWLRSVPIHVSNYSSQFLGLSRHQRQELLDAGYKDTREFFEGPSL